MLKKIMIIKRLTEPLLKNPLVPREAREVLALIVDLLGDLVQAELKRGAS